MILQQYEQVPHDYYYSGAFPYHSNTYAELCDFLDYEFEPITTYDADLFDCSEFSAYLEWALENAGFHAQIASGPTPWKQNSGYHAWVIVTTKDYQIAIEATRTPSIVYKDELLVPSWQNYYYGYDRLYENIYEAVRSARSIQEWNWWDPI
jgi:hypothetical protein